MHSVGSVAGADARRGRCSEAKRKNTANRLKRQQLSMLINF
jgi:hypothetical protein